LLGEPAIDVGLPQAPGPERLAEAELPVAPLVAVGVLVLLGAKQPPRKVVGQLGYVLGCMQAEPGPYRRVDVVADDLRPAR
jgi:hypothetical protein